MMIRKKKNKMDKYKELVQSRKQINLKQEVLTWQNTTKQQQSQTA